MGQNLFQIFWTTLKSRFAGLVSKLRLWTSWSFIRTRIIGGIRNFFYKLLDVKPKNKNDYYSVFGWLVSKKLAYAIVIILGVVSIWYLSTISGIYSKLMSDNPIRSYSYRSVLLRLAKNDVQIKGRGGYIAYEGAVAKGYCTGQGKLYNHDEKLLYDGTFLKNKYEGEGTLYYPGGGTHYSGSFHENLYEGAGKLFREDGTREYIGSFVRGMKEGNGTLYDAGDNQIFTGDFSADQIIYSSFLGKSIADIQSMYTGRQVLYEQPVNNGTDSAVWLRDINALCLNDTDGSAMDDSPKVKTVYVLSNSFAAGESVARDVTGLKEIFGQPIYEGNSEVLMAEAAAINILNDKKHVLNGRVGMDTTENFSDDIVINDYDRDYVVYIYSFKRGDLIYSFVCKGSGGTFEFYGITGGDAGEDTAA